MPFMVAHGACVNCGTFISFNPNHVPSLTVNGQREPLCRSCHARWNEIHRTAKGLPVISPHPQAYEPEEVS